MQRTCMKGTGRGKKERKEYAEDLHEKKLEEE